MAKAKYVLTEIFHRELFDTEFLSHENTDFFVSPIGDRGKTKDDTNMKYSAVIIGPHERMTVKAMPEVALMKDDLLLNVFDHPLWTTSELSFQVNSKVYVKGPLWTFAHPTCVVRNIKKFTQKERDIFFEKKVLAYDIPICSLDPFMATISTSSPDKSVKACIGLVGIYERTI